MNAVGSDVPFMESARRKLEQSWEQIEASQQLRAPSSIPEDVRNAIRRSVNCKTKTYRYVLPTQLLAKCVDPELDCRAIQKSCDLERPFDARSLCHEVIVPFDRDNHNVLGGSAEPYVSKPVRHPSVTPEYRASQKNKSGWDDLMCVLDYAQTNANHVEHLSSLVLLEIRERLKATRIDYPAPNRSSQKATLEVICRFLEKRSGGLRMQALSTALFKRIGDEFGLYDEVLSSNVNAADAATGKVADLECVDSKGDIVLAVEVKDRQLTLVQVQDKIPAIRSKGVRELLFVVQGGVDQSSRGPIAELIDQQFTGGHNLYILDWGAFLEPCLVLFGEKGRRKLLIEIGRSLDESRADLQHRRAWRDLLEAM